MARIENRPDIDGLRGISVLAVMFYHGRFGLPGGFAGVDVFFVISGFLITSIILKEQRASEFSLPGFWERRVRRIIPALAATVAACLILGVLLLLPLELRDLGHTITVQGLLGSNVHFWRTQGGYFATPAAFQPLLHTWSLALEEQFYLLYPLFIWAAAKARAKVLPFLVAGFGLSLGLAILATPGHPIGSFYLLPTRAWELLLGALLAWAAPASAPSPGLPREAAGLAGMVAILASTLVFGHSTPWPGLAALVPCLGTAAVIWSSIGRTTATGKLLAARPLVWVGLRSYSLYLVHWPLLVFLNFWSAGAPAWWMRALALCLACGLATVSYRFIETPFRRKAAMPGRTQVLAFGVAILAAMIATGAALNHLRGLPARFPDQALRILEDDPDRHAGRFQYADLNAATTGDFPVLGSGPRSAIRFLVWGDSHARAISPGIQRLCVQHGTGAFRVARGGCPPILDAGPDEFRSYNAKVFQFIRSHGIDRVLLVGHWTTALGTPEVQEKFLQTVTALTNSGTEVWLLRQVPEQPFDVPSSLARAFLFGQDPRPRIATIQGYRADQVLPDRLFARFEGNPRVHLLDPAALLFGADGRCRIEKDGHLLYSDSNHLSRYGALDLQSLFEPVFAGL